MTRSVSTAETIDRILLIGLGTGVIAGSIALPGATVALAPALDVYMKKYNKRQKEREYRRIVTYMKRQNLLQDEPRTGNGLSLTKKGRQRAEKANIKQLVIETNSKWDSKWHLVMFDIPESQKTQRNSFTDKLKQLGMYQLQRSVWVHPYPCREVVTKVAVHYQVEGYVNIVENASLDKTKELKKKFQSVIN